MDEYRRSFVEMVADDMGVDADTAFGVIIWGLFGTCFLVLIGYFAFSWVVDTLSIPLPPISFENIFGP